MASEIGKNEYIALGKNRALTAILDQYQADLLREFRKKDTPPHELQRLHDRFIVLDELSERVLTAARAANNSEGENDNAI